MKYRKTLSFLYSQLPMYSRIGKAAYKDDLTNTIKLCELLGNPEKKFRSIHIAGTNGKGSTSHMLAAVLQKAGYKTGLYTSPHLKDFRERIRINGKKIPKKEVTAFVEKHKAAVTEIGCSFFEWTVGLAFQYFAKEEVDIAIIETGLGGRLDSTNIITPVLSIITNISFDHTDMLGDTLQKIAAEKAGIIKENIPVVIGETTTETRQVFIQKASSVHAPIVFVEDEIKIEHSKQNLFSQQIVVIEKSSRTKWPIEIDLPGAYQTKNVAVVFASVLLLKESGFKIKRKHIFSGLSKTKKITDLRGRWDVLEETPLVIADVAHNEAGLKETMKQLKNCPHKTMRMVIGFVKEKELNKILPLLPPDALYYYCKPDIPRGLDENDLLKIALNAGLKGQAYASIQQAYKAAMQDSKKKDVLYVGGSTFVVAEVI